MSTEHALMDTYKRQPIGFERGEGVWLWDTEGNRYLDALAGVAVNTLGHAHPVLVAALSQQIGQLIHTSNLYRVPLQEQAADVLTHLSGLEKAFFCNSGLEANEAALKIARKFGHDKGLGCPTLIVMDNAFHGRSIATLSASGNPKVHHGFEPLLPGFVRVPLNDLAAVRAVFQNNSDVVGVMVEPVQGEGGVNLSSREFLRGLRDICDEHSALLICDEVQSGIGRTGTWFAFEHAEIVPDVVTLAKGIGSGVPVGACLVGGAANGVLSYGNHGSTFGGNPLAMRAVLTTFEVMKADDLLSRAVERGKQLRAGLSEGLSDVPGVHAIRGAGLMVGVELDRPCGVVVDLARDAGVLVNVTAGSVVRLLPPLIISEAEISQVVKVVTAVIRQFLEFEG